MDFETDNGLEFFHARHQRLQIGQIGINLRTLRLFFGTLDLLRGGLGGLLAARRAPRAFTVRSLRTRFSCRPLPLIQAGRLTTFRFDSVILCIVSPGSTSPVALRRIVVLLLGISLCIPGTVS